MDSKGGDTQDEYNKKDLSLLVRKRGVIKGRLSRYNDYIESLKNYGSSIPVVIQKELELKLNTIQGLISEFDDIQNQIDIVAPDLEEQITERDAIESRILSLLANGQAILDSIPKNKSHIGSDNESCCSHSNKHNAIKLPTIQLPSYDGNYLTWLEFKDSFESMIHNNDTIPLINKFHYLRSLLQGSAAVTLKSIEFSSNNYETAWKLLCQRFNNKNILVSTHLRALFNIETTSRESFKALKFMIDHVSKHLSALNTLGQPTYKWDTLIIYMVSSKLDSTTVGKWEEYKSTLSEVPTLDNFFTFIRARADVLETAHINQSDRGQVRSNFKDTKQTKSFVISSDTKSTSMSCPCCGQSHRLYLCEKFKGMTVDNRISEVTKLKLCKNCLRDGHTSNQCQLKGSCRICKKKHNSLLHKAQITSLGVADASLPVSLSVLSPPDNQVYQVLLCTALVNLEYKGKIYTARALLDTGSQSSFLSEELRKKIGLSSISSNPTCIAGINNMSCNILGTCTLNVKSCLNSFNVNVKFLFVPCITGTLPNVEVNPGELNMPKNIRLADPTFYKPAKIDILLGADVYWDIVGSNQIKLGNNSPTLIESHLGWLVAGPTTKGSAKSQPQLFCNFNQELKDSLERFWEIDELPQTKTLSPEERFCEAHFVANTKRLPTGRFSVRIPFKEDPETALGDSYHLAKNRLINLEKRFKSHSELKQQYSGFLKEYAELGHLTKIEMPSFGYYMPHHAVVKLKSETTRIRVVFDASARISSKNQPAAISYAKNKSLNDIQMVGPVVQNSLMSILFRFREYKYVLTADIEKMYRQIEVDESQRHLQLILWRENDDQPIEILQLNTVTYGTASAPFLSTRCLLQLSQECPDKTIANVIKNDFYIDDLSTGSDTIAGLGHLYKGIVQTLNSACLPLRKFRCNVPDLINSDESSTILDLSKESSVLGLNWSPNSDTLQFSTDLEPVSRVTKRTIIAMTCKIFDPLGLLCPCIIIPKILLQELWAAKLDWDDIVPDGTAKRWNNFITNLPILFSITIPRYVLCDVPHDIELHCFVDASQQAYAACVYLRSRDSNNLFTVHLLAAKARVAPMKPMTIPRLELCGALLGARLCTHILQSLGCKITKKVLWTDSTVVLGWLKTTPRELKTFVCNRVNEINEHASDFMFYHIPTDQNPADLASRGIDPVQLMSSSLWWQGPAFLSKENSEWPDGVCPVVSFTELPELKTKEKTLKCHLQTDSNDKFIKFCNHSSYYKLLRVYTYVMRFIKNCKSNHTKITGPLGPDEINDSLYLLIKYCQAESFQKEIDMIAKKKGLPRTSRLLPLTPFIDDKGLLRVGGRISNSDYSYEKKHPMILDSKHHFCTLIMRYEHHRLFHAGPQLLLASIRERFWPLLGRKLARNITKQCVICNRFRGKSVQPIMGNLPAERTHVEGSTNAFPFYVCGTDYGGPFLISNRKGRGSRTSKCYLCLFVCFTSKAVHLELVSELSTQAFLQCLRRFVSRRGKPAKIFCDNGTNFKGANNELCRLVRSSQQSLTDYGTQEGIKFAYSPPYSANFGGIFEAGIKSAKFHMKRIIGNASLTFEELATLFTQIEAILNSRPLTPLSSDPNDPLPLTPGHFLIGRPLTAIPSMPIIALRPNRYELVEKLRQHFWKRWRREFVAELQQRMKWRTHQQQLRVGDVVILKEDHLPPMQWRLGRIEQFYPGSDGINRVADVRTKQGLVRRALSRLCMLPATMLEPDEASNGAENVPASN